MNTALCFNKVLPYDGRPSPLVKKGGDWYLRLKEDKAQRIYLRFADADYPFVRDANGLWEIRLPFTTAINLIQLVIDDVETLSPLLPISYGYSRPYNYIELPSEDDFYSMKPVPHGRVSRDYFFSEVTGEWESCMVYTPPQYDQTPDERYPVLYLQHGHGENETAWTYSGRANLIMDNLIDAGKAEPFVIVMNNGMVQKKTVDADGRESHVTDHLLLETMLIRDVIPFIENTYRAGGCREKRAMAGLSMGSIQTSMIVCHHADMFCAAGIFSGFLRDWISASELDMAGHAPSANEHLSAMDDADAFNRAFPIFFRAIGAEDPFMEHFLEDDQLCREKEIACIRRIYEGTHDWNVWRRCFNDFAQMIFKGR